MTPKQRLVTAFEGGIPDRLPATTHHVMDYFLNRYMDGMSKAEFFDHFGLDPIQWISLHKPDPGQGEYYDPLQGELGFLESQRIVTDRWRVYPEDIPGQKLKTVRYRFVTPRGSLSMTLQTNEHTSWLIEHLIQRKDDIDLLGAYMTAPKCDVEAVNKVVDEYGERGIVRSHFCGFDVFGQGGTWQDACCLVGTQDLIMATFDDPAWVHELLKILHRRKKIYLQSMQGARYDILETGGGDASTTVISPKLFDEFVAPYDADLIELAHQAGQRVVYHTCGGMMPILERIAAMKPDAMETLTPRGMGGDVDLAKAKARIGDRVCMIGGFDQFHYFTGCTPEATRAEVRRCFEAAGGNGGFVLSPSDHFFDADPKLIRAYAEEARQCTYK